MHIVLVPMMVVALAVVVGAIFFAVLARRPDPAPSEAAAAARRHSAVVDALALTGLFGSMVVGLGVLAGTPSDLRQGLYLALIPAAAGLTFAILQALGELTWPRPTGTLRRAPLTRRTAADVAPRRLRRVTWAWAALASVALVACGLASDNGRRITRAFADGSAGAGPFPGWFYGVPLLVATAVVLLAGEFVLRLIAQRPAVMDAAAEWDLDLRRTSSRRLLRGTQLVLGWTAAGVLFFAGISTHSVGVNPYVDGVPLGSTGYAVGGIVLMVISTTVWIASTALLFVRTAPRATVGAAGGATVRATGPDLPGAAT